MNDIIFAVKIMFTVFAAIVFICMTFAIFSDDDHQH